MKNYIGILSDDIKRFINNYLIAGQLADVMGMSELEEYIPSKFPYLSILYLLNQNALESDASDFISKYGGQLKDETDTLKNLLGHFLGNMEEIEAQKGEITELNEIIRKLSTEAQRDTVRIISQQKKIDELLKSLIHWQEECEGLREKLKNRGTEIEVLKHDNETLRSQNKNLTLENLQLKKSLETFESKFSELNDSEKKSTSPSINNSKAIINISTTNHQDHDTLDLVDMGTSVLWNKFNLGANNELEEGDYYAWGGVSEANIFGSDVFGYNQVVKKHISGIYEYDAARRILGEGFRIPSVQDWRDLLAACEDKIQIVTIKGSRFVKLVSAKTKNQLLLPLIGHMEYDVCNKNYAQYWTSEQYSGKSSYICQIHETSWYLTYAPKWNGLPIRPVFDPHTKPAILSEVDDQKEHILISSKIVTETLNKSLNSILSPRFQTTTTTLNKKYPPKSKINYSNVYVELIKGCLPFGKQVFEYDNVIDIGLNLDKLNKILGTVYHVKTLSPQSMVGMKLKDLKTRIVSLLS